MVFDEILDKFDSKLEEIEDEIDDEDVPPWFGEKETDTNNSENDQMYELKEGDDLTVINIFIPDTSSRDDVFIDLDDGVLVIDIQGEPFDFEYQVEEEVSKEDIEAKHYSEENKLKITLRH